MKSPGITPNNIPKGSKAVADAAGVITLTTPDGQPFRLNAERTEWIPVELSEAQAQTHHCADAVYYTPGPTTSERAEKSAADLLYSVHPDPLTREHETVFRP